MEDQHASEPESSPSASGPEPQQAMLAHLVGGGMDLLCILALVAWVPALIIYMSNKDKSRFIAFHAKQALFLQLAVAVVNFLLWIPSILGLFLLTTPVMLLVNIGACVYSVLIGLKAKDGKWAEYAVIGDLVRKQQGQ